MRKAVLILLVAVFLFSTGCSLIEAYKRMPVKQRVMLYMRAFNAEFQDLRLKGLIYENLPEEGKKVIRFRAMLLSKIYPILKAAVEALERGEEPGLAAMAQLETLFFRLMDPRPEDVEANAPPPEDVEVDNGERNA